MLASIYTNQSTFIWNRSAPAVAEAPVGAGPMPWQTFWKRPLETYQHQSGLQIIITLRSRITTTRHDAPKPILPDLTDLKREILEEAQEVLRQEQEKQRAKEYAKQQELLAQAERQRLQRQADDDEELVMAASILFRDEPTPSWTIAQPRRRYGRRRK